MSAQRRHVLAGDLDALEFAIADYIVRWGQHLDGVGDSITGLPCAVANMAMTVIRKNISASWDEPLVVLTPDEHAARLTAAGGTETECSTCGGNGWVCLATCPVPVQEPCPSCSPRPEPTAPDDEEPF